MTATLTSAERQDLIGRALTVLEVGPVWDPAEPEEISDLVDRNLPVLLRAALTDHDSEDCAAHGECSAVTTARRVLALAGRQHDIVALRKVIVATVDADPHMPYGHLDDVLADQIAAAILVHQAGRP